MKAEIKGPACDPREFTITLMFENSDNFQWFNTRNHTFGVPIGGVKVTITSKEIEAANYLKNCVQGSIFSSAHEHFQKRLDDLRKYQGEAEMIHLQNLIDLGTYLYKTRQCTFLLLGKSKITGGLGLPYDPWMN